MRDKRITLDQPDKLHNGAPFCVNANLAEGIPPSTKHFSEFLGTANLDSIFFTPVVKQDIIDIVSTLHNKKIPGYDDINNFILKGVISLIVDPLVHVVKSIVT